MHLTSRKRLALTFLEEGRLHISALLENTLNFKLYYVNFYRLPLLSFCGSRNESADTAKSRDSRKASSIMISASDVPVPTNDVLLSKHVLQQPSSPMTPSLSLSTEITNDIVVTSATIDYPPNIAITPGSCKSPYFCTSPGFCNFPFHTYKTRHCNTLGDVTHEAINRTRSDPFPRDQVFIPDFAEPESPEMVSNPRRLSAPSFNESLSLGKPDVLSLPGVTNHEDFINKHAPITSLSTSVSSSPSLSSSETSIFTDPLLVDVTGNDVMNLLRSPKIEVIENTCFDLCANDPHSPKTSSLSNARNIRRSPPPPNVTLNPQKHKRSALPQGDFNFMFILCIVTIKGDSPCI